jgi:gliding motility-associated-like protein
VSGGVQGLDWEFAEGTAANDVTVAIEFMTQGCYQIQMSVLECSTQNNATPIDITVAGQPDITFNDISSLSSCTNINVGTLWQLASNNNLSVDFEILLDGNPLSSNTYIASTSCTTPGLVDFAEVFSTGFLIAGMHQLVFNATGDINTVTTTVVIDFEISQAPSITIDADITEGCSPVTVNFNSTATLSSVSAWNFGNGTPPTGTPNPQVTFECDNYALGDCVYAVSFTAISASNPNCITTGNENITVHPIPVAEFTFEQEAICYDENGDADILIENASSEILGLTCSGGVEPYSWTVFPTGVTDCTETNDQAPLLVASGTGEFTIGLEVTDIEGCTSLTFNNFEVYELPVPEVNFLQSSICLPLEVEILNTSIGAATFELEVPGFVIPNNFASPHTIDVIFPGIYEAEFIITSDDGCIVRLEIDTAFQAWHPPIANFTVTPEEITILDAIVTFGNESEGGTEYIWSFGDGEGSSEVSPEHEYERADTYDVQLLVTNEYGCTDAATQTIFVNSELQIFVPNAFTPNNDGNNDAWIPIVNGEEFIISYECWVYNRWGKLVFNSTTIGEPWIGDNTSEGNGTHFASSTESYSWKIELKQVDGRGAKVTTGNVFLIR